MNILLVISPRLAYYCVKRKVTLHKIILSGGHRYVLRAKETVMNTVTTVQENAEDIYEGAKQINEERAEAKAAAEFAEEAEAEEETEEETTEEVGAEAVEEAAE